MTAQPQPVLHATTHGGEKITLRPAEARDLDAIMTADAWVASLLRSDLA